MVTDAQKAVIKSTWSHCSGDLAGTGHVFYAKLKSDANHVFSVFPFSGEDLGSAKWSSQALKTMQFVDQLVSGIDNLDGLKGVIDPLAHKHTGFGAKKAHFPDAGKVLVASVRSKCGGSWPAGADDAWVSFYAFIQQHLTAYLS